MIFLPRQAWDKHREGTQQRDTVFLQEIVTTQPRGQAATVGTPAITGPAIPFLFGQTTRYKSKSAGRGSIILSSRSIDGFMRSMWQRLRSNGRCATSFLSFWSFSLCVSFLECFALQAATVGSYLNEGDFHEKDWQQAYWGPNYPGLLRVKERVDPDGLFVCHHCVGSGEKTVFLSHLCLKMLILPRQARDKHRENSKKRHAFSCRAVG